MSVTASKLVIDRQKSAEKVTATRELALTIAEQLAQKYPPPRRAEAKAAAVLLIFLATDDLAAASAAMVAADEAHGRECGDDDVVRAARDVPADEIRATLVELRAVLVACFGEAILATLGFEGDTATDPVVVHRGGAAVLKNLRAFRPPAARRKSLRFDTAEWIDLLEKPVAALARALPAVAADARQNQLTQTAKTHAIEAYDTTFMETANLLTGLCIAAGRRDLAERVRPSSRRPGMTNEDAPPAPSGVIPAPAPAEVA